MEEKTRWYRPKGKYNVSRKPQKYPSTEEMIEIWKIDRYLGWVNSLIKKVLEKDKKA